MDKIKICFFARVESPDILHRVNFYAHDIRILRELGHEVIICTSPLKIPRNVDLYFIWWWTWAFAPLIISKLMRKPSIITGTFNYETPPKGSKASYVERSWWQRLIIRQALKHATCNVFVSEYEYKQIPNNLLVNNPYYIPHSVETAIYKPSRDNKREPFLFNIAWSGNLNGQRKCLKQIIEAFAIVNKKFTDIRLVMAGKPGDYHHVLEKTVLELGLKDSVDFIGIISEEKKIDLMQKCSMYIQPTLFEGFGVATAEAMACGAPIISSFVGAVPEVVGDAGRYANGEQPYEIACAIMEILESPELAETLSKKAGERICNLYSYEYRKHEISKLLNQYDIN